MARANRTEPVRHLPDNRRTAPCHNLNYRAVTVYLDSPVPIRIGEVLTCGKDGYLGDVKVECWKAYGFARVDRATWPKDIGELGLRDILTGHHPIHKHDYGYFIGRDADGNWALNDHAGKAQRPPSLPYGRSIPAPERPPRHDAKAAAAGDSDATEEVPF